MDNFIKVFEKNTISTIEHYTKKAVTLKLKDIQELSIISNLSFSVVIEFSVNINARVMIALPLELSLYLSSSTSVDTNVLQFLKDIIFDIFDNINAELVHLYTDISFCIEDVLFIEKTISLESFSKMYLYEIYIDDFKYQFMFIIDQYISTLLQPIEKFIKYEKQSILRIRIAKIDIALEDILSLDIGSVIELEDNSIDGKLFDILLDRHIIAQGRFVIIDEQLGIEVVKFKGIS